MASVSALNIPQIKESQLREKGLNTTKDLANFFPRRYIDMRKGKLLIDVSDNEICTIDGKVFCKDKNGLYPRVLIKDKNNDTLEIVWFGNSFYYFDQFEIGKEYRIAGKISFKRSEYKMSNPTVFFEIGKGKECIYPIYPKIKGMSDAYLKSCIQQAILIEEKQLIPTRKSVEAANMGLIDYNVAIRSMHNPQNEHAFRSARTRLAYEKLYDFYSEMKTKRKSIPIRKDLEIQKDMYTQQFIRSLPFTLTDGQQKAVNYILSKAKRKERIDTLITGDVGCGKTIVAMIAALLLWENGFQSIIMAPTLVLAKQHYEEMTGKLSGKEAPVFALLTSETKKRERNKIMKGLANGDIDILIGTSSVLSDELEFANLGLTIIDEEHKFGTEQKNILEKKNRSGLHHIAMTATPIPRSLARTIYGEGFDIQMIQTKPKGRKPIITQQGQDRIAMFEKIAGQVQKGHQAYVICPFVQDSDSDKLQNVDSVESVHDELMNYYKRIYPSIRVDSINGKMKQSLILKKITEFAAGNIDVLISTTIVEVGVNVPNSTAILIMNADRFGLAALHQLRGRVGRSAFQSYCYLFTSKYSDKLDILCKTTDGFIVAEEDMRLRGPGNLTGENQTGYSEAIELIVKRPNLAKQIRDIVFK